MRVCLCGHSASQHGDSGCDVDEYDEMTDGEFRACVPERVGRLSVMSNPSKAKGTRAETAFTRWGNAKWPNPSDFSEDGAYVRRITLPGQYDRGDISIRVPEAVICNVQIKSVKTWLLKKWLADCEDQTRHAGVPVWLVVKPEGVNLTDVPLWVVVYTQGGETHYKTVGDHWR